MFIRYYFPLCISKIIECPWMNCIFCFSLRINSKFLTLNYTQQKTIPRDNIFAANPRSAKLQYDCKCLSSNNTTVHLSHEILNDWLQRESLLITRSIIQMEIIALGKNDYLTHCNQKEDKLGEFRLLKVSW